jgi:hypothetical protein
MGQNPTYQQKLYYTCKVWGFVKYYHSRVNWCEVNWDSVLVSTLPLVKNAVTSNDFNSALASLISAAGPMDIDTSPSPDTLPPELKRNLRFGWINDPIFRSDIKVLLDTIKNNFRPRWICWVHNNTNIPNIGYLLFPHDSLMINSDTKTNYPDEFTRLLLVLKYWNIINYFYPYNYVQDVPWDSTLYNSVMSISTAADYISFYKSFKKMSANIQDAHVEGLTWDSEYNIYGGSYYPRLVLKYTQNKYVVVKSGYGAISKGDIIVSIDSLTTMQWEDNLRPYISAGNPSVFRRQMCWDIIRGLQSSNIQIEYKDSLNNDYSLSATRDFSYDSWYTSYYPNDSLRTAKWKKWNCNVGYVNMGILMTSDVDTIYSILKNTSSIIFDLRNYPNGTAWPIANLIYPHHTCFSKLALPDVTYPGTFSWYNDYLGYNGNPGYYQGHVIILCNQETQSQAEFSCMILKAMPNSTIIGSQTAGTDGDVTSFKLSQDIRTGFTALGVYYPNGDSTERIGIVPDSVVYITAEGVRQGRDEVLEKALQVAGCLVPTLSITPSARDVPASAGTTAFTITCNTNWSVVSDTSWCKVISKGSGNGTIIADYNENTSHQARTDSIHVTAAGLPEQIVTLTQAKSTNGIEEDREVAYQICPNPTKGIFKIIPVQSEKKIMEINIGELNGNIILSKQCKGEKEYTINLSSAPQGIYDIIIKTDNTREVYKLVVIK